MFLRKALVKVVHDSTDFQSLTIMAAAEASPGQEEHLQALFTGRVQAKMCTQEIAITVNHGADKVQLTALLL